MTAFGAILSAASVAAFIAALVSAFIGSSEVVALRWVCAGFMLHTFARLLLGLGR